MSRSRNCIPLLVVFLFVLSLTITVSARANSPAITWYTGGEAKISLALIPGDDTSSIVLSGSTSQKILIVTVAKNNGHKRTNPIPVATDGSFNVRYLIKEGIGTYTFTLSGSEQSKTLRYQGLGFFTYAVKRKLPADMLHVELNDKIIGFVTRAMGSTVGRGECWDLAQQALDTNLADWTRPTAFGRTLNPESDVIKAGDIIQFRNLKITERLPGGIIRNESLGAPDHTAVIYRVLGNKRYTLAHQNVRGKRSVITSDINLTNATGGTYWIYRPTALMIQQ